MYGCCALFGFLHCLTGLLALLFETDLLYGTLLETDTLKPLTQLPKGSWKECLRTSRGILMLVIAMTPLQDQRLRPYCRWPEAWRSRLCT
jgi:hypothetical protein